MAKVTACAEDTRDIVQIKLRMMENIVVKREKLWFLAIFLFPSLYLSIVRAHTCVLACTEESKAKTNPSKKAPFQFFTTQKKCQN